MNRRGLKKILGFLAGMFLLFLILWLLVNRLLPASAKTIVNWQAKFFQTSSQIFKAVSLMEENDKLREKLAAINVDYSRLNSLATENDYLKKELNFLDNSDYHYQSALVIARLPFNQQQIIINAGAASGLRAGLAVTFNQGVMIGKIIKVEENSAVVSLLTENNSQLAVTTAALSGTNGLLKSRTGLNVFMELIPQDKNVAVGEMVITSGLEKDIPRGLAVGKISQVESGAGQIFKSAKVDPPFDYDSILWVTVIKS